MVAVFYGRLLGAFPSQGRNKWPLWRWKSGADIRHVVRFDAANSCFLFSPFKVWVCRALNLEREGLVSFADGVGAEVGYRRPNRIVRATSLLCTVATNKLKGKQARSV